MDSKEVSDISATPPRVPFPPRAASIGKRWSVFYRKKARSALAFLQTLLHTAVKRLLAWSDISNYEPPTIPPKTLKERALKRHGDIIQHALTGAKNLREKQAIHQLIQHVHKHMEAQRIIARDLLDQE